MGGEETAGDAIIPDGNPRIGVVKVHVSYHEKFVTFGDSWRRNLLRSGNDQAAQRFRENDLEEDL